MPAVLTRRSATCSRTQKTASAPPPRRQKSETPSSRHRREACGSEARFIIKFHKGVNPGNGEKHSGCGGEESPNKPQARIGIMQSVIGGIDAEVHAERKNDLDDAHAALTKFKQGGPQHVSQNQSYEVQVLRNLHDVMREHA